MFFYNPFLLIAGLVLTLLPQFLVKSTFNKFLKVKSRKGITGADAAKSILNDAGVYDIAVEPIAGSLTDHYDPRDKVLRLSQDVYYGYSIASLGVAAHEAGHAIQDNRGYVPMRIRSGVFPIVSFGQTLGPILMMAGIGLRAFMGYSHLFDIVAILGIILYGAVVVFQLITLPVELNASGRALKALANGGYLEQNEIGGARHVLTAAAFTYIAAALYSIMELLYWVWILFGRRRD